MFLFKDDIKKHVFIMAPKCGTNTIANYLNKNILYSEHDNYSLLSNDDYKKIIIYRNDIIDRFLSGFYEDLFNNSCYDNLEISFYDYLSCLYECFKLKISNLNNLFFFFKKDIPIWFGNCSNKTLTITNNKGVFCSHIGSQKYFISHLLNQIKGKNVQIIEINDLYKITNDMEKKYSKEKKIYNIDLSKIKICDMKKNSIIISKVCLHEKYKEMILEIYEEDILLINKITEDYEYYS
jgi:hypothetical protein